MRTLGLIGGTSWHSTIVYYQLINELVGERIGSQSNPPLFIYSQNIDLMRSRDWDRINSTYLDTAQKLEIAGAEAIVICANTPHVVYDYVQPKIDIPILHIAEPTGREASRFGLKKLGLLGNRPTMTKGFIQSYLENKFEIQTIIPEDSSIDDCNHFVSKELTQGVFSDEARDFFLGQMVALRNNGAEGIILGCTELPMLIDEGDFDLPMMATTQLHAHMAVEFIMN